MIWLIAAIVLGLGLMYRGSLKRRRQLRPETVAEWNRFEVAKANARATNPQRPGESVEDWGTRLWEVVVTSNGLPTFEHVVAVLESGQTFVLPPIDLANRFLMKLEIATCPDAEAIANARRLVELIRNPQNFGYKAHS